MLRSMWGWMLRSEHGHVSKFEQKYHGWRFCRETANKGKSMTIKTVGAKVLVVDDEERNRKLLTRLLCNEGYEHQEAKDGMAAISKAKAYIPDLILLDVMMPGMDGFEVAKQLKACTETEDIPIIMVTALEDQASRERGLAMGVEEFVNKPVKANELQIRVRNLLRLKKAMNMWKDKELNLANEVRRQTKVLADSFEEGIKILMRAAEYRDDAGGSHVRRICYYSRTLSEALGMDRDFCHTIALASTMHDVGKVGVPDHILQNQGKLAPEDRKTMESHTIIGAKILSGSNSPYFQMGKLIALCHHECWDGSGYPRGLKGEKIPLPARIVKICDIYDALRNERFHKAALSHSAAIDTIRHGDGRTKPEHFDPRVKSAFLHSAGEFESIFDRIQSPKK